MQRGGAFEESCALTSWTFTGQVIKTATAQVQVKLPAAEADRIWTLEFRSNQAVNPVVSVSTEILPQDPVPPDGYYTGSLFLDGEPSGERYPVRGVFENGKLLLVDDARVVSEDATIPVVPPYGFRLVPWARGQSAKSWEHATAIIIPGPPEQVRDRGALVGSIELFSDDRTLDLLWDYELERSDQEVPFPTCGSGAPPCGAGLTCSPDVNRCLPANQWTAENPSSFVDVRADGWSDAASAAAPTYFQSYIVPRKLAALVCHDPGAPGDYLSTNFMTVGTGQDVADTGELACSHGSASQAFPFLTAPRGFEMSEGEDVSNMLETCVNEIGAPASPAAAFAKAECLSPGRFFYALRTALRNPAPTPLTQRMVGFILRNWLETHELLAHLGLLESTHTSALASDDDQLSSPDTESVLDTLDRGWDVLLDRDIRTRLFANPAEALADPDYRALNTPLVYWSFNQPSPAQNPMDVPDVMSPTNRNRAIQITGPLKVWNFDDAARHDTLYVAGVPNSTALCWTGSHVNLTMEGDFTLAFNLLGLALGPSDGTYRTIFAKTDASFVLAAAHLQGRLQPGGPVLDLVNLEIKMGANVLHRAVNRGPGENLYGTYAVVQKGNELRLYLPPPTGTGMMLWNTTNMAPIPLGTSPTGQFGIHCGHPGLQLDDVMIFGRALDLDELTQIAVGDQQHVDLAFPLPPVHEPENPAFHDGVALQIEQAAHRHLDLLADWLAELNLQTYETCQLGQSSTARQAALVRVGRTLRRIINAQTIADQLVATIDLGALPWGVRYRDARAAAHAARARVGFVAKEIGDCENPLGIADSDLPMFYKFESVHTPQQAYFGSSLFLLDLADKHRQKAEDRLEAAHQAWLDQRNSVYHAKVVQAERDLRIAQIKAEQEATLTRLCGKPGGAGTPILDSVLTPEGVDYQALNRCFINTPQCNPNQRLESMSADCLRGQIGEQVLALQGSLLAEISARDAWERAQEQVEEMGHRCCHKQKFYEGNKDITEQFDDLIAGWRRAKAVADGIAAGAHAMQACASQDTWFSFGSHCGFTLVAGAAEIVSISFQEEITTLEVQHREIMQDRADQEDVRDCWFEWDQHKDVIDAQLDALKEASHAILGVRLELENMRSEAVFAAEQAQAQIAIVKDLFVDAPQHHFWFDDKIEEYRWSFAWARRLTYLAMQSAEYELQQGFGLRGAILRAKKPFELEQLHDLLFGSVMSGKANGHDVEFQPLVLSLRGQILRVAAPGRSYPTPAERTQAEIAAFQEYLKSNGTIIYEPSGRRLGRGFRFSLVPMPATGLLCGERLWRVSASLQFQQVPPNLQTFGLRQTNTFASTQCGPDQAGTLNFATTRPQENLLLPPADGRIDVSRLSGEAQRYTPMTVTAAYNRSVADLANDPPDTGFNGFAGRGLFGDFVLVFPDDAIVEGFDLTTLEDILLRFQLVAGSQ